MMTAAIIHIKLVVNIEWLESIVRLLLLQYAEESNLSKLQHSHRKIGSHYHSITIVMTTVLCN